MPSDRVAPEDRKVISIKFFYNAEKNAFSVSSVKSAFARVRLWPWRPEKNLNFCEKFYLAQYHQQDTDRALFALTHAVKHCDGKRISDCCDKISQMKPVAVVTLKTVEKRKSRDEDGTEDLQEEEQMDSMPRPRKARDILTGPPVKRTR